MDEDGLGEQPPSSKLVYKVLEYADSPQTQKEIADESYLSQRRVREALRRLEEIDAVVSRPCPHNAKRSRYFLDDSEVGQNIDALLGF